MSNSNAAKVSTQRLSLVKDRRSDSRRAPGYPSRKHEKLVDGLSKSELVVKYTHQVRMIAAKIARNLPGSVDVEDLVSVGYIGLMDAADKYDHTRNVKFATFAEFRIRGAILDELRSQDWVPRSVRGQVKAMEKAYCKLEVEKGRPPTDSELSTALGITTESYQKFKKEAGSLTLTTYGDLNQLPVQDAKAFHGGGTLGEARDGQDPFAEMTRKDIQAVLDQLCGVLSADEKLVVSCYYYRGLNLREISTILAVSESRVSQIHSKAIYKLKEQIKAQMKDQLPNYGESLIRMLIE